MLSGTMGAQLLALAALPVLSRLYSPEQFGAFSFTLALAAVAVPVAALRFEAAAMLPINIVTVRALVWNALLSSTLISVLFGATLQVLSVSGSMSLDDYPAVAVWVFSMTLLGAYYMLLSQLSLRKREYGLVAQRSVFRAAGTVATQISWGALALAPSGLLLGSVVGNVIGIGAMAKRTREFLVFPGWKELPKAWTRYWRFPTVFAPSAFLNSIGLQAPLIFFTVWFGIDIGGQLGIAERIIGLPLAVIGAVVGQLIEAEVSQRIRDNSGGLLRIYLGLSGVLTGIGVIVGLVFGLLGGWAVPIILGEQWTTAGLMVQILAVTGSIRLIASPLSRFLLLLQKSMANTVLDTLRVLLLIASIVAVVVFDLQLVSGLWVVYCSLAFTYVVTCVYVFYLVKRADAVEG